MSKLVFFDRKKEFEIWKFTPDLLHAFPFYMEKVRLPWRIRCVMEYFVGYRVYYIKKDGQWAGYCVVSDGRNPRYSFSTGQDIIYGRYFIAEAFRGNGLAARMLREILENCETGYRRAFAYLKVNNLASVATMHNIGALERKRFDIRGPVRKLYDNESGSFVLFEYIRTRNRGKKRKEGVDLS